MGRLGNFASALLGGLVVLAGQRGIDYYHKQQEQKMIERERQINAPEFRGLSLHYYGDGPKQKLGIEYLDRQSNQGVRARAAIEGRKEIDLLISAEEDGTTYFELPTRREYKDIPQTYVVYAIDRDGNESEKHVIEFFNDKWTWKW